MIDRHVGKQHGTGKKSETRNQSGHCSTSALITSGLVSRVQRVEGGHAPGVRDRLEHDPADRRVGDAEADDVADLVEVRLGVDRRDQQHGQAGVGAALQRLGLRRAQVTSPEREVGGLVEPVELQVDPHVQLGERRPRTWRRGRGGCRWC